MTASPAMNPVPVGLDDGYAYTKLVLPDGRKRVFDLVMRFGTSKSPKRTRSSTAY
ncbi:MAG: hypothetical protein GY949_20365 [Gammaproteobacteria bacterium]|nr:hypothetical protein [Gammaproteobacteria bacterium]